MGKRLVNNRYALAGLAGLLLAAAFLLFGAMTPEPAEAVRPAWVTATTRPMRAALADEPQQPGGERRRGMYTLLLAGQDNGNGNTDTLMLMRLDTTTHSIDVVSIPRDTMINTAWQIHKINAAYSMGVYEGGSGPEALCRYAAGLTGFEVDGYAIVSLNAFVRAVDAMGGVYFDVPFNMDYEDPSQNLSIHLQKGYQLLNGTQAMQLCRYRSGYASADLGRIDMQQRFLKACAAQFIDRGSIPNAVRVVEILASELETDMSATRIAWLLAQVLACKSENIRFSVAPSLADTVGGYSYTILQLEPWLELLNRCLNPGTRPITAEELDVVYAQDGEIRCTAAAKFR